MTMPDLVPARLPREVELLEKCRLMLSEAKDLDEIRLIRDQAEAIRCLLKQRDEGLEAQNLAAEIKLRAERRAGKLLKAREPAKGGPKTSQKSCTTMVHDSGPSLAELGVSRNQSSRWQQIANLDEEDFEQHIMSTKDSGKELTTAGVFKLVARQNIIKARPPEWDPNCGGDTTDNLHSLIEKGKKFRTIYADPPWQYGNQGTRASTDNHYGTMTVDEICAEPVSQLVEEDAHLHLWTTNAFLFDAKRVIEAWGFEYKSCFVWVKPQMGIGNYWRVSHEFLLFGIRGKRPFLARDEMSWASVDRTQHSSKPDFFRMKVERVSPGPYLEMYGRLLIPGSAWTVYGNQVTKQLNRTVDGSFC